MLSPLDRLDYAVRQSARIAWYMGHYLASQRYRAAPADAEPERPRNKGPGLARVLEEMGRLFARDLDNAERGLYPLPRDHEGSLSELIDRSRRYFADLPEAAARQSERRSAEIYSPELARELPDYFLQNFHFQTGGYLTEESAKLYDTQVEVLFTGSANAMRRQCLVPVAEHIRGRDQRRMSLLDVASGTGRFVRLIKQAFPRLRLTACDLSQAYLDEARAHVQPYSGMEVRLVNAEALPFADRSFDIVTSIYLFHEVPPEVRRRITAEMARVLAPGGLLVFMDSLQLGDVPEFDPMLENFPMSFHEPYYASYIREDLRALFEQVGLTFVSADPVFLSKRVVCAKPI